MASGQPLTACWSVRTVLHTKARWQPGVLHATMVRSKSDSSGTGHMRSSALRSLWMLAAACAAAVAAAEPVDSAGPLSAGFRAALTQHGVNATDPDHAGIWK